VGLPQPLVLPKSSPASADRELPDEAARIAQALSLTAGNVVRAARLLGMSRDAVRYRTRKYGIVLPIPQLSPATAGEESDAGDRMRLSSLSTPILDRRRPAQASESIAPPAPILPPREAPIVLPPGEPQALVPSWEQKPVAVLALELTWPVAAAGEAPRYEPGTATRRWEQAILEKVRGFGGVLLQRSPSLLLVAFGIQDTLEQLPQRAVQAALALRQLLAAMPAGEYAPELRQAVHWGQLLVDVEASDPTAHLLSVGETLAQPVRLLDRTTPGGIVVSSEVSRLVEGWFELRAHQELLGDEQRDRAGAYTVVTYRSRGSPLRMYRQRPLSRFVGRAEELAALEKLLAYAENGKGQVVRIVGEPGVGKSRLCYEFIRVHSTQGWLVLETSADSYGQSAPSLLVIDLLKSYFQIASGDDVSTLRDKVVDKLSTLGQPIELSLPALLTLMDAPVEDAAWQVLDPPQRRQRIIEAVKYLLLCESEVQPLCLVVENLHWIDRETQGFLDSLVESLPATRVLLLVSYRPEYQHRWTSKTYYTQLRLDPLPPESAQELAQSILGNDTSVISLTRCLIELTEGTPFFLEESIQTLMETRALIGERDAYRMTMAIQHMQVPATVHMVLAARIDRLPIEGKRLLQLAAVIGKDVPLNLLQAIAELPIEVLRLRLSQLQSAEFLYEQSLFPKPAYTFKRALTQQVAYESLYQMQRKALHARIIGAIETLFADRLAEQVDRLAYHALRGEVWDKALTYCRQAGAKATERSAYRGAVAYFEQALDALQHLPESRDTIEQAIDLRFDLRNTLSTLGDHGPILEHLRQAETLAQALGDQGRLGPVFSYMSRQFRQIPDYDRAIASGERALAIAAALGDFRLQVATHAFLGQTYYFLGDYRRALDIFRRNMTSLEGDLRGEHFGGGVTAFLYSCTWLVASLAELGAFTEGVAHGEEQVRAAKSIAQPEKVVQASFATGLLSLRKGDLDEAIATLERGLGLCKVWNLGGWLPILPSHLGYAYALSGRVAKAVPLLEQVLGPNVPITGADAFGMAYLSEAYLLAGRREEAMQFARRALALSSERNLRGQQAWVLRLLGEIGAQRDPSKVELAEAHYRQALALAEELGMRPLAAHCHRGLGTLYAKVGRREQAGAELSMAIELYRAMDMTFWLPQAQGMLVQVE
jgi:tetratricopeptide (TPR) repeat protein